MAAKSFFAILFFVPLFFFAPFKPVTGPGSAAPVYSVVEKDGARAAELTLLTYNVQAMQKGKAVKEIAGEIRDTGAQIVFLQEVDYHLVRSLWRDEAKELAAELGFSYAFFPASWYGGLYGSAILSAFPLSGARFTRLPTPFGMEKRTLGQVDITIEGTPVRLFVTHLSWEDTPVCDAQLAEVSKAINAAPGGAFLLGGDFNTRAYDEFALLENAAPAFDAANGPAAKHNMADNIFCPTSGGFALRDARIVPTGYSDHDLVLAEVSIPLPPFCGGVEPYGTD